MGFDINREPTRQKFSALLSALAYTSFAGLSLGLFANAAKHYPPNSAPDGVEGVGPGISIFLVAIFIWVYIAKQKDEWTAVTLGEVLSIDNQELLTDFSLAATVTTIIYYVGAVIATYDGTLTYPLNLPNEFGSPWVTVFYFGTPMAVYDVNIPSLAISLVELFIPWTETNPFSWASFAIVSVQATLLGLMFELGNRPKKPFPRSKSNAELEHAIDNWRQFTRILLTSSVALGIGFFLQTYSRNYVNAKHMVWIFGTFALGIFICLLFLRSRIVRLGSYLN